LIQVNATVFFSAGGDLRCSPRWQGYISSGTMRIAPQGHSATQMPQPLQ
jgi:hypothetical protein